MVTKVTQQDQENFQIEKSTDTGLTLHPHIFAHKPLTMKKNIGIALGVIIGIGAASSLVLESRKIEATGACPRSVEERDSTNQNDTVLKVFQQKAVKWSDEWLKN